MDNKLITLLDTCKDAIIKKDIVTLISSAKSLGLDDNSRSPLLDFIENLIIEDIKDFMIRNKKNFIDVSRKNIYHEKIVDCYSLKDGELFRNGHKAIFSSVGKLYIAYKRIHEII